MANPETRLTKRILDALNGKDGVAVWKIHGSVYQEAGISDILGCAFGVFLSLEVKLPRTRSRAEPSKIQEHQLRRVKRAGGVGFVITSVQEALDIVSEIREALSSAGDLASFAPSSLLIDSIDPTQIMETVQ